LSAAVSAAPSRRLRHSPALGHPPSHVLEELLRKYYDGTKSGALPITRNRPLTCAFMVGLSGRVCNRCALLAGVPKNEAVSMIARGFLDLGSRGCLPRRASASTMPLRRPAASRCSDSLRLRAGNPRNPTRGRRETPGRHLSRICRRAPPARPKPHQGRGPGRYGRYEAMASNMSATASTREASGISSSLRPIGYPEPSQRSWCASTMSATGHGKSMPFRIVWPASGCPLRPRIYPR